MYRYFFKLTNADGHTWTDSVVAGNILAAQRKIAFRYSSPFIFTQFIRTGQIKEENR